MSAVKRFVLNFCRKFLPTFAVAFVLGIALNAYFGRYAISYSVTETFTKAEAESLLNKRILDKCLGKTEAKSATVVSYEKYKYTGTTDLVIEFDQALLGRFKTVNYNKEIFEKCVELLEK